MDAEKYESETENATEVSAGQAGVSKGASMDKLPKKPAADVIAASELLQLRDAETQKWPDKSQPKEAQKATLASLGSTLRN